MPNPNRRYIALNGNGGAYVAITLSMMARYVEITEDTGASAGNGGVAQGLQGNIVDPVTGALQPPNAGDGLWPPMTSNIGEEAIAQIALGDHHAVHGGQGVPVGGTGATVAKLRSNTATPTQVIVREYY